MYYAMCLWLCGIFYISLYLYVASICIIHTIESVINLSGHVFVLLRQVDVRLCLYVVNILQSVFVVNEWSNGCVIDLWLIFEPLAFMVHM